MVPKPPLKINNCAPLFEQLPPDVLKASNSIQATLRHTKRTP